MSDDVAIALMVAALNGHNVFMLGQPGTGKTKLIWDIYKQISAQGKRVHCTASTGIAASHLPNGTTIHKFSGIRDGRFSNTEICNRINNDMDFSDIKIRISQTDALIIDEISMISMKTFLQIEVLFRSIRNVNKPFGGIQIILSGDFYQLKPVPNVMYDDPGDMVISHHAIRDIIPHKFILNKVHRQMEESLVSAVRDLSQGTTSSETNAFLHSLQRPLADGTTPVKLFALNYDVDKCNSDHLLDMPGEIVTYKARDAGDLKISILSQVPNALHFKEGAPVILTVNLTDTLVNGIRGIVKEMHKEAVTVFFAAVKKTVTLSYHVFPVYSMKLKRDVASRMQIPLRLAFALTVHKAQGMSIDRLEIDCRHMNLLGQIGVAVGRGINIAGLRVLNYKESLVQKQPSILDDFYNSESKQMCNEKTCCSKEMSLILDEPKPVPTVDIALQDLTESEFDEHLDSELVNLIAEHHDDETEKEYDESLPNGVNVEECLNSMRYDEVVTINQKNLNDDVICLIENRDSTDLYFITMWIKFGELFRKYIPDKESKAKVENKHTTAFYKAITEFISTDQYKMYVGKLFPKVNIEARQLRAAYGIVEYIRRKVVEKAAEPTISRAKESALKHGKAFQGSDPGRGKIRYISGWCVGTLMFRKKQAVKRKLFQVSAKSFVNDTDKQVKVLEQLTVSDSEIRMTTTDVPSLMEIKRKQNIRQGLCNVTDECFSFFMELDITIRQIETVPNLNLYGKDLYIFIRKYVLFNEKLQKHWSSLFGECHGCAYSNLLDELVTKYLRMSSSQFKREFVRSMGTEKEMAHRKQVQCSKRKTVERWSMKSAYHDKSVGKMATHRYIQSELENNQGFFNCSEFKRYDLLNLASAYNVSFNPKQNKHEISVTLSQIILKADKMIKPDMLSSPGAKIVPSTSTGDVSSNIDPCLPSTSSPIPIESESSVLLSTLATDDSSQIAHDMVARPDSAQPEYYSKKRSSGSKEKAFKKKTKITKWPCGICGLECTDSCVACDECDKWHHYDCLGKNEDDDEFKCDEWLCLKCSNNQ